MVEQWKAVPGYEAYYEVSDMGRVRSHPRICHTKNGRTSRRKGFMLKPALRAGYPFVQLAVDSAIEQVHVHRLVAIAFCHKPDHCAVVNHLDGDKTNNCASNLEWTTHSGNAQHAISSGLKKVLSGAELNTSILTAAQVNEARRRMISGETGSSVAKLFSIGVMAISDIRLGKKWLNSEGIDKTLIDPCKMSGRKAKS